MSDGASQLKEPRARRGETIVYGLIGIPIAAIGLPFAVFMPRFYATDLGLGLELTGLIFMIVRFTDVATDPIMGILVDRFPSRYGRVRHWLCMSVPILLTAAVALYLPSRTGTSAPYLLVWLIVFYIGFTMLQTPHQAWVPVLTSNYDARSRYFMWRQIFMTVSLLALLSLPTIFATTMGADNFTQVAAMGWFLIISLPVTVAVAIWWIRDPRVVNRTVENPRINFSTATRMLRDSAMARILSIEVLIGLATSAVGSTYLFAAEWGFGVKAEASAILILYFLAGLISMPFWLRFAEKTDKHHALVYLCVFAAATHLIYLPLSAFGSGIFGLITGAVVSGIAFGAPVTLLRSMMADVAEQNLVRNGADHSGLSFAFLTSAYKTGQSFAIGIPFVVLGLIAGFDPVGDNSPEAIRNLMLVFAGLPALVYSAAAYVAYRYPLTRSVQATFRAELDAQEDEPVTGG